MQIVHRHLELHWYNNLYTGSKNNRIHYLFYHKKYSLQNSDLNSASC